MRLSLFKQHVPAFRDFYLVTTGPFVGARETRRIAGERTLTAADIDEERRQEDVVTLGCWYRDRHPRHSSGYHMHEVVRPYDIGFGTLLPKGLETFLPPAGAIRPTVRRSRRAGWR